MSLRLISKYRMISTLSYNQMSNKFKIEYYHKLPQTTSPYLQLLQAKKKIFGYKYELIRSDKPVPAHNKSISHTQPQPHPSHKHSKTQSHEKQKPKSQKQNSRKKRSHTEQAEQRLHQSLFLNRDIDQSKQGKHQATKSLFAVEGCHDQSINPHDFMRNYKNVLEPQQRNVKSYTQQVESKGFSRERPHFQSTSIQKLQISEIDDLITLIDSCVQQANDYISYLTEKIQSIKTESSSMREEQIKILKMKDTIINEKQHQIDRLRKEMHAQQYSKPESDKTFEIKKLLEIIDKITEENNSLKGRLRDVEHGETRNYKDYIQKQKKDIYNEIHNKIDILNISIDKKNHQNIAVESDLRQSKKGKNNKPKFYK